MKRITLPETQTVAVTQWSSRWPTVDGVYWFYGYPWGYRESKPDLLCVQVHRVSNGFLYATEGYMLTRSDGATGLWSVAQLPAVPTVHSTLRDK